MQSNQLDIRESASSQYDSMSTATIKTEEMLIRVTEYADGVVLGTIYYQDKAVADLSVRDSECLLRDATTGTQIIASSPVVQKI